MSCLKTLQEKGYKLTPQRRLIVDIIHDAAEHLTAEDIIAKVYKKMRGVNKSTIYRTLDILEETGCVVKSELDAHFIYHHTEEGHHHHLVCHKCGKTIDCGENIFLNIEKCLAKQYGFKADFKHLLINGVCQSCSS
jgi:Fur family ferric uptake transcriptional regulator